MAFKVQRGELRASGSHEDPAVCHRDASSSILPLSSHNATHFVKISDESPETVFLLQCLLHVIWDYVQCLFASCHILDFNNSLPCGVLPSTHTLYGNVHFLINQSHHCEAENIPFSCRQRWRNRGIQSTFSVSSIIFCSFAMSPPICHFANKVFPGVFKLFT